MLLNLLVKGQRKQCNLRNVLHVTDLGYQLLSLSIMDKQSLKVTFKSERCLIKIGNNLVVSGTMYRNIYKLDIDPFTILSSSALLVNSQLWHERLGHVDPDTVIKMSTSNHIKGLPNLKHSENGIHCSGCILGRGQRNPIPKKSEPQSSQILDLVHSEVNGPFDTSSVGGSLYFISFINDFLRWTVDYTMKRKYEALHCFKKYHSYANTHTGSTLKNLNVIKHSTSNGLKLKSIRSDNGGEYISNEFKINLEEHGIQHQLKIAYTPQQNGVAERMNRTLLDLVRSMLHSKGIEFKFWAEALSTATYIRNRVPSPSLPNDSTPFNLWMKRNPDLSNLRTFGCKCWYVTSKVYVKKLDPRSREAIMVGYSLQSKGYKLLDHDLSKFIISREIKFIEACRNTTLPKQNKQSLQENNKKNKSEIDASSLPGSIENSMED